MKINYDEKMQERIERANGRERLLLQSCCAPCSTACLSRLKEHFRVTILYYNPNIDDEEEYEKRKAEQIRLLQRTGWADFLDCDHDRQAFEKIALGLENEPEKGKRCYLCYGLRLEKTAQIAKEQAFDLFATTLSVSPYKNAAWLNEWGERLEQKYGVEYLPSDFKKKNGYRLSQEFSKEYGLYRQDYCGCRFSKTEAEEKRKRSQE